MNLSIPINFAQLKTVIAQCDLNEKLELFGLLEKDTFPVRFKQFISQVKSDALSLEEITAEVEAVRRIKLKSLIKKCASHTSEPC